MHLSLRNRFYEARRICPAKPSKSVSIPSCRQWRLFQGNRKARRALSIPSSTRSSPLNGRPARPNTTGINFVELLQRKKDQKE